MAPWSRTIIGAAVAACVAAVMLAPVSAHEGHDHGAPPPPVTATIAPRADASSSDFELVLVARGDKLALYLDTFRENQPVDDASIEIDGPTGVLTATPDGAGAYTVPAPFIAKPGAYDLAITISAKGMVDILAAKLTIPPSPTEVVAGTARATASTGSLTAPDLVSRITDGSSMIIVAGAVSFLAGALAALMIWPRRRALMLLVALVPLASTPSADVRAAEPASAFAARDISQRFPDGALFVPKLTQRILGLRTIFTETKAHRRSFEMPGRIIADPNGSGLVQASVGGQLMPPDGGFKPLGTAVKAGDILAYVRPPLPLADLTAQQQQERELDQQISLVARKVERLRTIQQVIARSQLEDAELELAGLRGRRANLDRVRRDPEALVAPVSGVIAASNAVAGQMAEPNAVIVQIVDPSRLWVEALTFEPQSTNGSAQGLFADGRTIDLVHVGTGLADRNQSVPVHFAIRGDTSGLRAGQFLTVIAQTQDERRGIALPREAVLRAANGQSIVYDHSNAERFVPREVRIEPLDAERVLVVAGIGPGQRIVTRGTELLNQIR
jgi:hypothetical protein